MNLRINILTGLSNKIISYILECQRCGKQHKVKIKPESDKICPRCGDIMGPLTENQMKMSGSKI